MLPPLCQDPSQLQNLISVISDKVEAHALVLSYPIFLRDQIALHQQIEPFFGAFDRKKALSDL